jgi:1,4-alpha-glucan branching enzyme
MTRFVSIISTLFLVFIMQVSAQESIDVTFRFTPNPEAVRSFVPGSFNNWGNNSAGRIATNDGSLLLRDTQYGFDYKVVRLQVGGGTETYQGRRGYAYKFHEHYNASGTQWAWFTDPLNPVSIGPNSDSFIEITIPTIFQLVPSTNAVVQGNEVSIWAAVASTSTDPINPATSFIRFNGENVSSLEEYYLTDRQLVYVPSIEDLGVEVSSGTQSLEIVATTVSGLSRTVSSTFTYLAGPEVVREARPAGLEDGVTVKADRVGSVSFSLFAPGKEFVYLIGDHSNWEVKEEFLMKLDEARADSAHFWIELDGLDRGTYRFQYLIDGDLRIADLFSEQVLDPDFDRFIAASVYPDMPEYPVGKTSGMVGVFQVGAPEFVWEADDYERPAQHELIIYELLLRDFVANSTFNTLTDTLDYLQRLGINAIELMPVSNFDGNDSWGYNPNFQGALDKSYGTPESFKRFVDEAHKRGIAVILDVVYNHAQDKSPLVQLYGMNRSNNPFLGPAHAYNVFFHLNHDNSYIQYWLDRMNRYWLKEYNIDGYRFDLTKGFASNVNNQSLLDGYNPVRIRNLKRMADRIWEVDPKAYVILEHFAANTEEKELAEYRTREPEIDGMMLWGNMNHTYNEGTMGYFTNANFSGGYFRTRGWNVPNLITYMESHDEQWLMYKNLKFGACSSAPSGGNGCNDTSVGYNVRKLETALDRQKLAGAFFYTIPGPKMMWQFGELGYGGGVRECLKSGAGDGDCLATDPGRTSRKPIRWDYRQDEHRYRLYETWSEMIQLRRMHPVFHDPSTNVAIQSTGAVKHIRLVHPTASVVIVGNFGVTTQSGTVTFPETGTWHVYEDDSTIQVESVTQSFTLEAGAYRILSNQPLQKPGEEPPPTSIEVSQVPESFNLYPNYPNPFNPSTEIVYDLATESIVVLRVYDILGRQVAELVNERMAAGTHRVTFNASNLSSGTYLVRLETAGRVFTRKMALIK